MFEISPKVYTSLFSLPTEIADRGLKFASGEQLKVIICIFRNPQITVEEITKITNLSLGTVNECVEYWVSNGILKDSQPENTIKTESQIQNAEKVKMPLPEIHFTNPTQAEIENACQKASIHDFILSLPEGYKTKVAELGTSVSAGERQRIGLARIFLKQSDLILLDEPTSNLDSLNEAIILKSLKEHQKDKTIILVSHRPQTLKIADRILQMENGRAC
jgi:ABC-type dipeptide/oligopeptide/nickel transport system ATPase subunit